MSTGLLIFLSLILIAVIVVQIGKVSELAAKIRGEEEVRRQSTEKTGIFMLVFLVLFLFFGIGSAIYYQNWMLGYGPHESASLHGLDIDYLFNVTLFFTGIVFVITQIALFYFSYKYRENKDRKAAFISHDNKLEIIWTAIPAVVMTYLVVGGLDVWNTATADIPEDAVIGQDYIEIEAVGQQFLWHIRYPGDDNKLGARNYQLIKPGVNPIGQDWNDDKNLDDFYPTDIVLPKGKPVRVRINALDVLHNFDLPHFRVKMDAVPGMPTYFNFTPIKTTEEYRQELRKTPEYQAPSDASNPDSNPLWQTFEYELACAELCGSGHYSMRKIVRIVEEDEYLDWLSQQKSYYMENIRNTDDDPNKGKLLGVEISQRKRDFNAAVQKAMAAPDSLEAEKIIRLEHVTFETGSANLTELSRYEIDNVIDVLKKYPNMTIELGGHTDNVGDPDSNLALSEARATSVYNRVISGGIDGNRLSAVGFGQTRPTDTNDTPEGRQKNRRTEFKILTQ